MQLHVAELRVYRLTGIDRAGQLQNGNHSGFRINFHLNRGCAEAVEKAGVALTGFRIQVGHIGGHEGSAANNRSGNSLSGAFLAAVGHFSDRGFDIFIFCRIDHFAVKG